MRQAQREQEAERAARIKFLEEYARTHAEVTVASARELLRREFEKQHQVPTLSTDTIAKIIRGARAKHGVTDLRTAAARTVAPRQVQSNGDADETLRRAIAAVQKWGGRVVVATDGTVSIVAD